MHIILWKLLNHIADGIYILLHGVYFPDFKLSPCLNVVCFLMGNSLVSEFYMLTFKNTLFHLHRQVGMKYEYFIPTYK